MTAIVVDDEDLAMEYLLRILGEASFICEARGFSVPLDALDYIKNVPTDVAFLDIEMFGMNGIELAKQFKTVQPGINIIFVTGYPDYAIDAFSLHASGYLLKPASLCRVQEEIANLRVAPLRDSSKVLAVQTFGNFEVFYNNIPLDFGRGKAKELFAYLVDRRGAGCTTAERCAVLWEDRAYSISLQKQFQTIVSDLLKTLRSINAASVVVRKRNSLSVDPTLLDCDYYRFLLGEVPAINSYTGEYMANYSWAEFTTGFLSQMAQK